MLTISGARTATKISTTMKPSATMETLSRRSRRQNSWPGDRAAISLPEVSSARAASTSLVDVELGGRLTRAHGRPPVLRAAVVMMSSSGKTGFRAGCPARVRRCLDSPLVLRRAVPAAPPPAVERIDAPPLTFHVPDYDPCIRPR